MDVLNQASQVAAGRWRQMPGGRWRQESAEKMTTPGKRAQRKPKKPKAAGYATMDTESALGPGDVEEDARPDRSRWSSVEEPEAASSYTRYMRLGFGAVFFCLGLLGSSIFRQHEPSQQPDQSISSTQAAAEALGLLDSSMFRQEHAPQPEQPASSTQSTPEVVEAPHSSGQAADSSAEPTLEGEPEVAPTRSRGEVAATPSSGEPEVATPLLAPSLSPAAAQTLSLSGTLPPPPSTMRPHASSPAAELELRGFVEARNEHARPASPTTPPSIPPSIPPVLPSPQPPPAPPPSPPSPPSTPPTKVRVVQPAIRMGSTRPRSAQPRTKRHISHTHVPEIAERRRGERGRSGRLGRFLHSVDTALEPHATQRPAVD